MHVFRHSLPLVVITLLCLLAGCSGGSYTILVGNLGSTDHGISGNYKSFNGSYYRIAKFHAGDIVDLNFNSNTQSGELTAELLGPDGHIAIIKSNTVTSLAIPKNGTYKIQVNGNKHTDGFALGWRKRQ